MSEDIPQQLKVGRRRSELARLLPSIGSGVCPSIGHSPTFFVFTWAPQNGEGLLNNFSFYLVLNGSLREQVPFKIEEFRNPKVLRLLEVTGGYLPHFDGEAFFIFLFRQFFDPFQMNCLKPLGWMGAAILVSIGA